MLVEALYIVIWVLIFAIGATFGSFLNVLVYRLPLKLDFVKGSSFCPKCEHKLSPLDLIPILSWVFLRRKCRYCKETISPRYPLVETAAGVFALASWLAFVEPTSFLPAISGMQAAFGMGVTQAILCATIYFIVLSLLLAITLIDFDTMEIPDSLNISVGICGALYIVLGFIFVQDFDWLSHLIGIFAVSVPMLILTLIIPNAFGGGDIKMLTATGLFLGWQALLVAVFIGIIIGGIQGIFLLSKHKLGRKEHFAFGPALCIGIAISMFASPMLINWYLGFF